MPVVPPLTVAVPLLVAGLLAATGAHLPRTATKAVALLAVIATCALQFTELVQSWGHPLDHWFGNWTTGHGVAIGVVFTVSPLDAGMACVVGVLAIAALGYAWRGLPDPGHLFYVLMLAFVGGMSGFAVNGDLFDLFVFFELMSIAGYALCGYRNTSSPVVQGAINFAVINSVGSLCILMGIALIYGRTGALNLAQIGSALEGHAPDGLVLVSFVLIVIGFLVKAGAVPFHFWLSDAYAVAAAPVGALYAGIMSDLGYHAISRVYSHAYAGSLGGSHTAAVRGFLVGVGVVTAVVGAVMCYLQADTKRQLAFLVVSHGGIFCAALGLLTATGLAGSTLYVAADGMLKGALFLVIGYVVAALGASDELWLRGRGRSRQHVRAGVALAACGIGFAAVPGSGPWTSAALVVRAAAQTGYGWLPPILAVATAMTAGTVLRTGARVFLGWGPSQDPTLTSGQPDEPEEGESTDVPARTWLLVPAWLLAAIGLLLSVAPSLTGRAIAAAAEAVDLHGYLAEVLHGRMPVRPEVLPAFHAHGGEWLYGVATTAGAFAVAFVGLFWPVLPAAVRRGGAAVMPVVRRLKTVHSGGVGDYVVWFGVGAVVMLAVAGATFR